MDCLSDYTVNVICRYDLLWGCSSFEIFLKTCFFSQNDQILSWAGGWPLPLIPLSADIPVVICDTPEKASVLLGNVEKGLTPGLKMIILMDPFDDELKQKGEKCGVELLSLFDAEVGVWNRLQLVGCSKITSTLWDICPKPRAAVLPRWHVRSKLDACSEALRISSSRPIRKPHQRRIKFSG